MQLNYYSVLGLNIDSGPDDIKKAYKVLSHKYHPDKKNGSIEMFRNISSAYAILKNPVLRADYNKTISSKENLYSVPSFTNLKTQSRQYSGYSDDNHGYEAPPKGAGINHDFFNKKHGIDMATFNDNSKIDPNLAEELFHNISNMRSTEQYTPPNLFNNNNFDESIFNDIWSNNQESTVGSQTTTASIIPTIDNVESFSFGSQLSAMNFDNYENIFAPENDQSFLYAPVTHSHDSQYKELRDLHNQYKNQNQSLSQNDASNAFEELKKKY